MKLAFCLFNYFAYGGLQRDFMRIAQTCLARGHEIHVFAMRWDGAVEPAFHTHIIEARGWQNHTQSRSFVKKLHKALQQHSFDLVIGFNKMPHLDVYYAADVCYAARMQEEHGPLYRLLPRYREWSEMEAAVFDQGKKTQILLISPRQQEAYTRCYQTEPVRFHLLPPGIARDRLAPPHAAEIRQAVRATYRIAEQDNLLLMVGSGFKTKGVDRSIRALAALPAEVRARCHLLVVGRDDASPFLKQAKELGIENKVSFLGARDDVGNFLLAADLLLHPSYHENTGTVLLEAMASALPVLTVAACGYAGYVSDADAGKVLAAPFKQIAWNQLLLEMLQSPQRKQWGSNGLHYAQHNDIYSLPERAADFIEMAERHELIPT